MTRLVVVLSLLLIAATPLPPNQPQAHKVDTAAKQHNERSSKIPVASNQPSPKNTPQPRNYYSYNYYYQTSKSESPPVLFQVVTTIALIVFSCGLWITSIWQWKAIKDQANAANKSSEVASKTLLLQFRPKLIIRNVAVDPVVDARKDEVRVGEVYYFVRHQSVKGRFYVANIGDSPATVTESLCMVQWRQGDLPMRRPYSGKPGNNPIPIGDTIRPGGARTVEFESDRSIDINGALLALREQPQNMLSTDKGWGIYIMGWIKYADDLGFVRRTAFCRRFDGKTERFIPINDPDYEHAE